METAKVDIRKLQLLNDRINQCIDALNQVRLSVHGLAPTQVQGGINPVINPVGGLSHSPFAPSPFGAMGAQNPLSAYGQPGFGVSPYAFTQGYVPGISHTTGLAPQAQAAFLAGVNPFVTSFGSEALESSLRAGWADPLLTARIAQTFPYAQFPVPPVVTIY